MDLLTELAERGGSPGSGCSRMLVAQLGARMHYAVPELLADKGRLAHFYTDIHGGGRFGRLLNLVPQQLQPASLRRLAVRSPEVAEDRISSFDLFGLAYAWRRNRVRTADEDVALSLRAGRSFCERIVARGFGDATAIYAFNSAALELAQSARRRGLRVVLEQTIAPRRLGAEILRCEARKFPGWDSLLASDHLEQAFSEREAAEWENADLILCGSPYVRDGIAACGGPADRCVVVPYGTASSSARPELRRPHDGPIRILTIGQVGLRKGSPYVIEAAKMLGPCAEFRLVGPLAAPPRTVAELARNVTLTGPTRRSEVAAHYAWADVFLLPSLHEGSATVIYEALAAGLPVICTHNAGSLVSDGVDGLIVPPRDSEAIVAAVRRLQNVDLRARMARQARETSKAGSLEAYGARLLCALDASGGGG